MGDLSIPLELLKTEGCIRHSTEGDYLTFFEIILNILDLTIVEKQLRLKVITLD